MHTDSEQEFYNVARFPRALGALDGWKRQFPVVALTLRLSLLRAHTVIIAIAVLHNICRSTCLVDVPPEMEIPDAEMKLPMNNIDLTCLEGIGDEELKILIPENQLRDRIKFKISYKKYCTDADTNTDSLDTDTASMSSFDLLIDDNNKSESKKNQSESPPRDSNLSTDNDDNYYITTNTTLEELQNPGSVQTNSTSETITSDTLGSQSYSQTSQRKKIRMNRTENNDQLFEIEKKKLEILERESIK
ncbi:putative nuclease HARBI1 [Operophtera brumata]|uniref:Putative nuclease HARBI1 n=1 Tax=Operophtera brumata TaxID=104452 RepID=A0A0L7KTU6_OPEBR|nr:putative nuclease HARBI1 [Operophtera brumata]